MDPSDITHSITMGQSVLDLGRSHQTESAYRASWLFYSEMRPGLHCSLSRMNFARESTVDGDGLETHLNAWDGLDLTPLVTTNHAEGASLAILLLTHSAGSDPSRVDDRAKMVG